MIVSSIISLFMPHALIHDHLGNHFLHSVVLPSLSGFPLILIIGIKYSQ